MVVPVITGTQSPGNCVQNFFLMNTRPASDECLWRVVTLPAIRQAVAHGRAWSRETLKEWQLDDMTDVVQQLVSELVTNSVEHADTCCVRVMLVRMTGTLRLDVTDDDVVSLPVRAQAGVDDIRGRGLAIVEALSDRWGVHVAGCAKTVWCELLAWRG
ncbi:MAG TPA: ATP-binding protein [Streptosporangiaceae bacterium]|nr:ATP-binding protein [Streptosporangiaceae bacterium]